MENETLTSCESERMAKWGSSESLANEKENENPWDSTY